MERQEEFGLQWQDFGARNYDPALGRWTVMDPVTHYDFSPYNAFDNNPVFFADPSGMDSQATTSFSVGGAMRGESFSDDAIANSAFGAGSVGMADFTDPASIAEKSNNSNGGNNSSNMNLSSGTNSHGSGSSDKPEILPAVDLGKVKGNSLNGFQKFRINNHILNYFYLLNNQIVSQPRTWVNNWAESTNIFSQASYGIANSFSVVGQSMNPFDDQVTTLTGEGLNGTDRSEYGAEVAANLLPIGSAKIAMGPLRNWVRFIGPKGVHGSYSKFWATRTSWSLAWGASPIQNGKFLKEIPSSTFRKINQAFRKKRFPFVRNWRTIDRGHFHIKL